MTSSLVLDRFVAADAAVLREVDGDAEHRLRFDFPTHFNPSERHSREVIARWDEEWRAGTRFAYAVRNAARELVGGCELAPVGGGAVNLSYWTHPAHRGRGVASEAVRQLCALAFRDPSIRTIELLADADNTASRGVAARNGFRERGTRDGQVLYLLDAPGELS